MAAGGNRIKRSDTRTKEWDQAEDPGVLDGEIACVVGKWRECMLYLLRKHTTTPDAAVAATVGASCCNLHATERHHECDSRHRGEIGAKHTKGRAVQNAGIKAAQLKVDPELSQVVPKTGVAMAAARRMMLLSYESQGEYRAITGKSASCTLENMRDVDLLGREPEGLSS